MCNVDEVGSCLQYKLMRERGNGKSGKIEKQNNRGNGKAKKWTVFLKVKRKCQLDPCVLEVQFWVQKSFPPGLSQ